MINNNNKGDYVGNLLFNLSKESLVFLVLINFNESEVKNYEVYEGGIRFEMNDGRVINVKE